jgi:hypothetical protein
MAFSDQSANIEQLPQAGAYTAYQASIVLTAPYTDGTPLAGHFVKVDNTTQEGTLTISDGDYIGVAVMDTTNLNACGDNPLQTYITLGLVYVVLKDGVTPRYGDFVKVDATGTADIGAKTDGVGIFLGRYGADFIKEDGTTLKTMQIQLGGI